jgi:hypothetical protein
MSARKPGGPDFTRSDTRRTDQSPKIVINFMAKQLGKYSAGFVNRGWVRAFEGLPGRRGKPREIFRALLFETIF